MLQLLDESLEAFLRSAVPLPVREVDIAFEAPDRDWSAGVSRPTIDLYLWDVRPNLGEREFGVVDINTKNGRRRQESLPRVDCRYLVTAWTSDVGDEHSLLGRVLGALLLHPVMDAEHLVPRLADVLPLPSLELRGGAGSENSDFWSALGGQLKPGLDLVVTATVDAAALHEAGPPVEAVVLRQRDRQGRGAGELVIADRSTARAGEQDG
jgi:Pvc16 N-terminal domain